MSRSRNSRMNKYQKHPKVPNSQYLFNAGEPDDNIDFHISAKLEAEILENNYITIQRIRRDARRMRGFEY